MSYEDHSILDGKKLQVFIKKVLPSLELELKNNSNSKAFDRYSMSNVGVHQEVKPWKVLSVDLEKQKVRHKMDCI